MVEKGNLILSNSFMWPILLKLSVTVNILNFSLDKINHFYFSAHSVALFQQSTSVAIYQLKSNFSNISMLNLFN